MSKIIIKIDDEVDEIRAMEMIRKVIGMGRVSETKYGATFCFVTSFKDRSHVYCDRTKTGTDTIRVSKGYSA
jgi:hypothetical protein